MSTISEPSGKVSNTDCEVCEEIHRQGLLSQPPSISKGGKIVLAVAGGTAALIYGLTLPFILPGFRKICLPYVPATEIQIQNILKCLKGRTGSVIDLGSGDGRIINSIMIHCKSERDMHITKGVGVELNTWLVLYSKFSAWRSGLQSCAEFKKQDIFKTDLKLYDNIVVFGVESLMSELEFKLEKDLKEGSVLIACRFPLPNWTPVYEEGDGIDQVWVYNKYSSPNYSTPV